MNELKIYYPFKPFVVTQKWGNPNPMYRANGMPFDLHNGIDAWAGYDKYPVYCPVEGFTVLKTNYAPNGGGNEVWLISDNKLKMFDQTCHALLVFCHADKILVKAGDKPKLGELLMVADNTGFSTGIHTHIGLYRVDYNGITYTKLYDTNQANGSFNPGLFMTEEFAVDKATLGTLITNGFRFLAYYTTLDFNTR